MVRTRLNTKFHNWSFKLRNDEYFFCLYPLTTDCNAISFKYCEDHGYTVYVQFIEAHHHDDLMEDLGCFAWHFFPTRTYQPATELPEFTHPEIETQDQEMESWLILFGFWVTVYTMCIAIGVSVYYK